MALPVSTIPPNKPAIGSLIALREFPWQNGIVLETGTLEDRLRKWLDEMPEQFPEIDKAVLLVRIINYIPVASTDHSALVSLPQGQARSLDRLDISRHVGNNRRRVGWVEAFLNTGRENFLDPNHFNGENNLDIGVAVQFLLRFQMFDQLAGSIGFSSKPERITAPRLPLKRKLPTHLQRVSTRS